jgi:DNA-directed RNA polymerase subunit RPC12/RpoP
MLGHFVLHSIILVEAPKASTKKNVFRLWDSFGFCKPIFLSRCAEKVAVVFQGATGCPLNVCGPRIYGKKQSVATGAAQKLKLDESTENSQRASGAACMARNVINDHCKFEIGLKRTIGLFFIKRYTTIQITRQLQCNYCNFEVGS